MFGKMPARWRTWGLALLGLASSLVLTPTSPSRGAETARVALGALHGPDGRMIDLTAPKRGVTALVFYSSECPISNAYSSTLNALVGEFPEVSLKLVGVCVDPDLSVADVQAHAKDFGLKFPVACDHDGALAAKLGAKVTPEAFVIDAEGRVRYHGRIDDQFAARQQRNANPTTRELHDAIAAVLAGRAVASENVPAVGCPIPVPQKTAKAPTYCKDVAAILQKNCQECHRRGQVGPFPLETFEQARKRADDIASVVEDRQMPPWKPAPGVGPKFQHDRSLAAAEIATLTAWAAAGAPEGDPRDLPPAPTFHEEWTLGTPDLIVEMPEEFQVPASGDDIYRCFVIPTDLPSDMSIAAIEYRPGNRRVVHHIVSYSDTTHEGRKRDEKDPGPGYSCFSGPGVKIHGDLGGWTPGNEPRRLPDGIGRILPRGADVIMQVHYHPSGKPETDRSRFGIHFARKPIKQALHWGNCCQPRPATARGPVEHRGQGGMADPDRRGGAGGPPAHAPARPRHRHVGQVPRRPRRGPGQDPPVGLQLAEHLLVRDAARPAQGDGREGGRPTTTTRRATPATRTGPPSSSSGARPARTRCASATSPSSRRGRTSPSPVRRMTSARS